MAEETEITLEEIQHNFHLKRGNADGIAAIMTDADDLFGWIQRGRKDITMAALEHEEAGESEKIEELDAYFRQLLDLETRVANQKATLQTVKRRIDIGEKMKDLLVPYENIQQQLLDRLTSEEAKYLTNKKYVDFRQNIWNVNHPDELMPNLIENGDDDIVMGSTKISLRCPLTATWFENPVTSKNCKHTFSRDAIISLLRQSGENMPCPIPGCDKRITQQLLENDEIMADRVRRSKARDEQNASNTQFFDVE